LESNITSLSHITEVKSCGVNKKFEEIKSLFISYKMTEKALQLLFISLYLAVVEMATMAVQMAMAIL